MRKSIFFFLFINSICFGQKIEIENLINQIAKEEVSDKLKFYYLLDESYKPKFHKYSLENYQKLGIKNINPNFPFDIIRAVDDNAINWKDYDLKNVKYIEKDYYSNSPKRALNVFFVKHNIDQEKLSKLIDKRKINTVYVKKRWYWSKKRIYTEASKAAKKYLKQNPEENIFFSFSKPIFSSNNKYAKVTIAKHFRCKGEKFTAIYKNDDGIWYNVLEYNHTEYIVTTTHTKCEDITLLYKN